MDQERRHGISSGANGREHELAAFGKATELRQRIWFTLGLLIIYRIGTYIPVPGIDGVALRAFFDQAAAGLGGVLNMFTGGALSRMGVFALGIMPYISASIIVQLMAAMVPALEQLKKEGEQGRKKLNQYTRYGTVFLATRRPTALRSAWNPAASSPIPAGSSARLRHHAGRRHDVPDVAGRADHRARHRQRHLADHLRRHHRRNPAALAQFFESGRSGALSTPGGDPGRDRDADRDAVLRGVHGTRLRKIHIQYPRRQVGMKVYDGGSSHLPVKVNPAGVIPAIFASSLLLLADHADDLLGRPGQPAR
jgi:preprotein translocase subunit SecY